MQLGTSRPILRAMYYKETMMHCVKWDSPRGIIYHVEGAEENNQPHMMIISQTHQGT